MKIACISDLHGNLPKIPPNIDLLLIAGDLCWHENIKKEELWLTKFFEPWLLRHNINTIAVAGNHDFYLEKHKKFGNKCLFLENSYGTVIHRNKEGKDAGYCNKLSVYGTPLALDCGDWAYMAKEEDIFKATANKKCDIMISHGPMKGILDSVLPFGEEVGSECLRVNVDINKPKLFVCGHIHESRGVRRFGNTVVINASIVDRQYRQVKKIYVVDWKFGPMSSKPVGVSEWDCDKSEYIGGESLY